ncbi:hypothetical protein RDWZM_010527 [Blomia tropicalis]|uniref:Sema domain-containing protein n=1 Tax=Blomia tropicalis TaxID=40697 RepID=A0A9Q0M170_BLOTA|nr:hypothetical protein RDWZM_010527 [Blomia tropicalis]
MEENENPKTFNESYTGNVFNFCNEAVKLNGSIPLRTQAALVTRDGSAMTSITAGITGQHTVAFVGTAYGSVKKILLQSNDYAEQFDEVMIDQGHPILADMMVDSEIEPKHLIVASPYKVMKLPVETCVQHETCDRCLQARNPYCGWCSLQKRCTIKSECLVSSDVGSSISVNHHVRHYHGFSQQQQQPQSSQSSNSILFSTPRWLSLETSQCIDFQAIKPEFMPRDQIQPVELIINQLPPLPYGANYLCVFEQSSPIPATVTRHGLACQTPSIVSRPTIPLGQDHTTVNLAVRSSETDTDFIHRSFIFYDCSVHKSCKSCVMSTWNCNWCMHENVCTHNTSTCTRRVIVGENSPHNSLIKGVEHCPSFSIQTPIRLPNGARKELRVEVRNLIPSQDGFQCIVEIEQAKERVTARVQDNNIICHEIMLTYQEEIGEQNATLTVLWNGDTFIDRTNVTLYKCQYLGAHTGRPDCSLCQTLDPKYGCVWCHSQCSFVDQCGEQRPSSSCPPPRIDYIHPISGPVEGGTLVSIEGSNLGSSLNEIRDRLSIGGIPCTPIEYNISIRVICRTGASAIGQQSALVVIGNRAGVTRAQAKFQYKTIELDEVIPKIGPQSGGSRIYLIGKNLNIGSNMAVYLDDLPCTVERALASSSQLSCRTSAAPYSSYVVSRLTLSIDAANFTLTNPFLYTPDPTINRIEPMQSYFSGGRTITVTGTHFTSIQQPRLMVFTRRQRISSTINPTIGRHHTQSSSSSWYTTPLPTITESTILASYQARLINDSICTVISATRMQCTAPMINANLDRLASKLHRSNIPIGPVNVVPSFDISNQTGPIPEQIYLQIGFVMDDTISVLELDNYYPQMDSMMLYVADPTFYAMGNGRGKSIPIGNGEEVLTITNGDLLVIDGDNLASLTLTENEFNITIGMVRCNVSSITMRQVICSPPIYPPSATDELGRKALLELPVVVVRVGNLRRVLGYIHYGDYYFNGFVGSTGGGGNSPFNHRSESSSNDNDDNDDTRFYHQNAFNRFDPSSSSNGNGNNPLVTQTIVSTSSTFINSLTMELLIGILLITGMILAIISIIVLAAYKHKTNEAEREYKRIQLQMDTLENNVRSECKQAFAELQTDILQATGIFSMEEMHRMVVPTHDERTFIMRMFFANTIDGNYGSMIVNHYGGANSQHVVSNNHPHSHHQHHAQWYNSSIESAYYTYHNRYGSSSAITSSLIGSKPICAIFWNNSPYFHLTPGNLSSSSSPSTFLGSGSGTSETTINIASVTNGPNENFYTLNRTNHLQLQQQQQQQSATNKCHQQLPSQASTDDLLQQLFMERNFLLILVETIESQKSLTNVDRTHFASLITLLLLDRMDYTFDVMRHLLARVLDRIPFTKGETVNNCGLFDAGSDLSITEKLLIDWLSICLFKYAKEVSAGPLFLLYSAIKHQIDKGPVDYVTSMSRYSLSEERLLREQIDYRSVTVYVTIDDKLKQLINGSQSSSSSMNLVQTQQQQQQQTQSTLNRSTIGCRTLRNTSTNSNTTATTINRRQAIRSSDLDLTSMTPNEDDPIIIPNESIQSIGSMSSDRASSGQTQQQNGVSCRILDCDTISQVKGKIIEQLFRSIPFSERPTISDVILYYRCLKPKPTLPQSAQPNSGSTPNPQQQQQQQSETKAQQQQQQQTTTGNVSNDPSQSGDVQRAVAAALYTIQDIYSVAGMMSKADADRIYNASRRSDLSLMEMTDIILDDYDHSTQILTANEAIWRRLNTISHYGIADGASLILCARDCAQIRSGSRLMESAQNPTTNDGGKATTTATTTAATATTTTTNSIRFNLNETLPQPPNDDDQTDPMDESNYHLYESIPAMYGTMGNNGNGRDRSSSSSLLYGNNYNYPNIITGTNQESVYNLSTASSNGGKRNYYGIPSNRSTIYGRTNSNQQQQQHEQDQTYGSSPYRPSIYSPCATLSPNYSQTRLLRNQSLLNSTNSSRMMKGGNNGTIVGPAHYLMMNTSSSGVVNTTNRTRRSLARNFYERLSSLVRTRRSTRTHINNRHPNRSKPYSTTTTATNIRSYRSPANRQNVSTSIYHHQRMGHYQAPSSSGASSIQQHHNRSSYDYEYDIDEDYDPMNCGDDAIGDYTLDDDGMPIDHTGEMRHNVWHLVKPSSLIADCIIGASGCALYDQSQDHNGRRNIRMIKNRRELLRRRRRRRSPFGSTNMVNNQMVSVASAVLSASQINLSHTQTMLHQPQSVNHGINHQSSNVATSPLSLLTNSASSIFASIFALNSQNNNNNNVSPTMDGMQSGTTINHQSTIAKSIPEIYLTRLLSTKGTIQQYIDDLLRTIFTVNEHLPIAVKWLFDFFDTIAIRNGSPNEINVEQLHLWKSNCLLNRFWCVLLRTPEMLFDIGSTIPIDGCFDVLANNLIDAALVERSNLNGTSNDLIGNDTKTFELPKLTKDSPPAKLLFARDIPAYRSMIGQYYHDIALLPPINESDIIAYMKDVSKTYENKVSKDRIMGELMSYVVAYKDVIFQALAADPIAGHDHLHLRFDSLINGHVVSSNHQTRSTIRCDSIAPQNGTIFLPANNTGISRV